MLRSGGIGNLGPLQSCQGPLGLEDLLSLKKWIPYFNLKDGRPGFIPICAAHLVHKVRFDAMRDARTLPFSCTSSVLA